MTSPSNKAFFCTLFAIAIGLLLRVGGIRGDLWLYEIWSLNLVSSRHSLLEVLSIAHDNSHPINSIWLYLCGPEAPFWLYRLFSLVCSVLSLVLVWRWAPLAFGRSGPLVTVAASFSYLLILYGSEARGYGPMVLAALFLLRSDALYFKNPSTLTLLSAFAATLFGMLSHLTFVQLLCVLTVARLIWSFQHGALARFALLYGTLWCVTSSYLLLTVPGLTLGGGPRHSLWDTFLSSYSFVAGGELIRFELGGEAVFYSVVSVIVFLLAGIEALRLWRQSEMLSSVLFGAIVGIPIVFLWLAAPEFAQPRYILVSLLAVGAALMSLAVRWWYRDRVGKLLCVLLVGAFLGGNLKHDLELFRHGRGAYQQALIFLRRESKEWPARVQATHRFRVATTLDYYAAREGIEAPRILSTDTASRTQWRIDESTIEVGDDACAPAAVFPTAPLSGSHWLLSLCAQ